MKETTSKPVSRRAIALLVCGTMAVSGCMQTMPTTTSASQSEDEQAMRQQGEAFNKTVIEGAAIGAVVGALAGALIRRDVKGALVGAAAGAAVGGGTGYYLAQKQKQYAGQEQRMDAVIADVRADNERLAGLITASNKVIAADKKKIDRLKKDIAAGKITKEDAKRELASVDENEKYLRETITNLKKRQEKWTEVSAQTESQTDPGQKKEMDREMKKLEKQIASLEKELDTLVQRRKILPVA